MADEDIARQAGKEGKRDADIRKEAAEVWFNADGETPPEMLLHPPQLSRATTRERHSRHKPLEASERRWWVRRLLSRAEVVPPPEAGRCETAAAVVKETEAQNTVRCPPEGRTTFLPAGDCSRRIGGRSARSSRRSRRRVQPLRERSGAARPRCEAGRGPRRMKESHATSGTGVSRSSRRRGEEDVRTRVARATTSEARSRQALSSDTTRAGTEQLPSEGRRDPLDPHECKRLRHGQRAPTGP
ncbi:hypothetical protein NDU88_004309 [Pleurodeles waltl]|uniref:Uncharacterized protein n=1 Tax=Pleurodeles waltl TaxID=8319 RepID=A0AAV7QHG0_PLEWA|nr:hypothetical protein NDU88_004309 [Pleurodeles waltl]